MLRWRLLLGTLLVAVLAGLCWSDRVVEKAGWPPGMLLVPLALAIALGATHELLRMLASRKLVPISWVAYVGVAAIVLSSWVPELVGKKHPLAAVCWPALAVAAGLLLSIIGELARFRGKAGTLEPLACGVLIHVYVGLLFSIIVQLRFLGNGELGIPALAWLITVVKCSDTGAYTVGRLIGRHKLAPHVSPGKTLEGLAGGLALACAGSWIALRMFGPGTIGKQTEERPYVWIACGLAVGCAGVLGDLAESLLKRDLGHKDSSTWMPGFGGILDIVDSLLLAAPVAYLCWIWL